VRLRHSDGTTVHVAYCTNVHPAEDLAGVIGQLERFGQPVREQLGADRLGLGLWLARDVATELVADPAAVARLRRELDARGLEVVTFNGFPYRGFHSQDDKLQVYSPNWSEPERLAYTLDLASILTQLLPDDAARGSISSLPLGWRDPWGSAEQDAALRSLETLADELRKLAADTGRAVRVGLEAEPGCVVETTEQAVRRLAGVQTDVVGVCLDACHLAVQFEEPAAAIERLSAAGLPIVKLQASAALHADDPADPATREALGRFVEGNFIHQTRELTGDGVASVDDLDAALDGPQALPGDGPWRVHFHVPLHADAAPPLRTTSEQLGGTIDGLFAGPEALTDTVECETYTWQVLPPEARPYDDASLAAGIARELAWVRDRLVGAGLSDHPGRDEREPARTT
jgi:sugar phosphate isomerase/epimerase